MSIIDQSSGSLIYAIRPVNPYAGASLTTGNFVKSLKAALISPAIPRVAPENKNLRFDETVVTGHGPVETGSNPDYGVMNRHQVDE